MGGAPFLENEYNCTNWYFFRKELRSPFNQVITLDLTVYDCLKNTLTVHHVVTLTLTFYPFHHFAFNNNSFLYKISIALSHNLNSVSALFRTTHLSFYASVHLFKDIHGVFQNRISRKSY